MATKRRRRIKDIVPDEEAAAVVKRIFELCASGKGPSQIARILTAEQVLTREQFLPQIGASMSGWSHKTYAWCSAV
jgi:hypothetical protein